MTRKEIEEQYEVNENGVITSPGKFEGEMYYAVTFYHWLNEGEFDRNPDTYDNRNVYTFKVNDTDRVEMPELNDIKEIHLWEDNNGFVHLSLH